MTDDEPPPQPNDWAWLDADEGSRFSPLEAWPPLPAVVEEAALLSSEKPTLAELLEGSDSLAILRRIMRGDPLGLEKIVHQQLDRLAVMFHPTRLLAATQARCAWAGATATAPTPDGLTEWVCARMSEAMESLTQEDWSEDRQGLPADPMDERYILAQGPYGLTANQARRVALIFNQQAPKIRRPLYAVLVKGRAMTRVAETFGLELGELKTLVYDCLASFRTTDAVTPVDLADLDDSSRPSHPSDDPDRFDDELPPPASDSSKGEEPL